MKMVMMCIMILKNNILLPDLEVDVTASLNIDDYFNHSSFKLNLVCTTMNYPPTCVTWSRNDEPYSNYTSSSTEVISNTSTIYTSKISVPSTDVIGKFTCAVVSNGTILRSNSDTVYVEGTNLICQITNIDCFSFSHCLLS